MGITDAEISKATARALDLLAMRRHTSLELERKLCRHFETDTARIVAARMAEMGYLNEMDFAEQYAAELVERKGLGTKVAAKKLRERGVSAETVEQALAPYVDEEQGETARIVTWIEKKYRTKLQEPNGPARVFDALLRRGFAAEDIRAAIRTFSTEE